MAGARPRGKGGGGVQRPCPGWGALRDVSPGSRWGTKPPGGLHSRPRMAGPEPLLCFHLGRGHRAKSSLSLWRQGYPSRAGSGRGSWLLPQQPPCRCLPCIQSNKICCPPCGPASPVISIQGPSVFQLLRERIIYGLVYFAPLQEMPEPGPPLGRQGGRSGWLQRAPGLALLCVPDLSSQVHPHRGLQPRQALAYNQLHRGKQAAPPTTRNVLDLVPATEGHLVSTAGPEPPGGLPSTLEASEG